LDTNGTVRNAYDNSFHLVEISKVYMDKNVINSGTFFGILSGKLIELKILYIIY